MKKRLLLAFSFICLFTTFFQAQETVLSDVLKINLKNIGPILDQDEVKGYYMFYETDKVDRKTRKYMVQILDENLNVVGKKYITGTRYLHMVEGNYNGENIMLKFADPKEKTLIFRQYDKTAEMVSKKAMGYNPKYALYGQESKSAFNLEGASVIPIPKKGFANFELVKNKKWGYEIKFFPNSKTEKGWTFNSKKDSKDVEMASFMGANEDLLLAVVAKRPSILSKKLSYHLLGIDVNTGKKRFEKKMGGKKYNVQYFSSFFNEDSNDLTLFGLYFDKEDKVTSNQSKGLCAYTMNKDGEIISKKHLSWTSDISKVLPVNKKGKIEDIGYMFFHNIFRTSDGKMYAVAEQYKRNVSAMGVAVLAMGGAASATKVVVEDIMVFEFSPEFDLTDIAYFEKSKSNQYLAAGGSMMNMQLMGLYVNYLGGFDYVFTQKHRDSDVYSFVFNDYNRETKNWQIKSVTHADGEYAVDNINMKGRYSDFLVFQGKKGHVMIAEYNAKDKKLDLRLEKINF